MALDPRTGSAIAELANKLKSHDSLIKELIAITHTVQDTPKWIDQLPGKRVAFFAVIELTLAANSTSKADGTYTVSDDGPFICTGVAPFYKKTTAPYDGIWGPVSTVDARIAPTGQQHGYAGLLDQPHVISGTLQIVDRGSERNWQNKDIPSALFAPQAGGCYVLPVGHMFRPSSVIEASFTPGVATSYAGTVAVILCGYKIVGGNGAYQP